MSTTPLRDEQASTNQDCSEALYSPGTPTTAEEPLHTATQAGSASGVLEQGLDSNLGVDRAQVPTPTEDEFPDPPPPVLRNGTQEQPVNTALERSPSRSLSSVSNVSLPSGDAAHLKERIEEDFSSLSSDEAMEVKRLSQEGDVDLEDGEIMPGKRVEATGGDDDIVEVGRRQRRSRSRSGSLGPGDHHNKRFSSPGPRKGDLPRYDVRYLINRKRRERGLTGYRSRSRSRSTSPRPRPQSRRLARRSSSRSRSPYSDRRRSSYRRSPLPSPPPSGKKKRKSFRGGSSPLKKKRKRRSRSSSISRSRSRSRSPSQGQGQGRLRSRNRSSRNRSRNHTRSRSRSLSRSRSRNRSMSPKKKTKKKALVSKKSGGKTGKKKSKTTSATTTGAKKKAKNKAQRVVTRSSSPPSTTVSNPVVVTEKEVYASGDKIMVSVNFKQSQQPSSAAASASVQLPGRTVTKEKKKKKKKKEDLNNGPTNKAAVAAAQKQKPVMVIDVMSSPYQVFEASPTEVIDVASEEEKENTNRIQDGASALPSSAGATAMSSSATSKTAAASVTPLKANSVALAEKSATNAGSDMSSEVEELVVSPPPSNNNFHKGPCTPPADDNETLDLAKGPQTPESDTYDPCDPTESPDITDLSHESLGSAPGASGTANGKGGDGPSGVNNTSGPGGKLPFFTDDLAALLLPKEKRRKDEDLSSSALELPMDIDVDSPCSPQGSDLSDLFEPPSSATKRKATKASHRNGMKAKPKRLKAKSTVQMKLIDDKLKIIDDVPTSAVEMAVKEKFLRKVQRQERIVDEIKAVLKPFYNHKKISKESYKDIMRKCVPKVCHSKTGAINTTKIQKLVRGYVRKYKFMEKKLNKAPK